MMKTYESQQFPHDVLNVFKESHNSTLRNHNPHISFVVTLS